MGVALLTAGFVGMVFTIQVGFKHSPTLLHPAGHSLYAVCSWRGRDYGNAVHSSPSCGLCCPGQLYCVQSVSALQAMASSPRGACR